MTNICKYFKKNEYGMCENYIGDTDILQGCRRQCKKFKKENSNKVPNELLEKQIVGFETQYEK